MNAEPINIEGIKFFDTPDLCIAHYKEMPWMKKAISLIQSFGTLFSYALTKINLILHRIDAKMEPFTKIDPEDLPQKRLIVCLHGLNNNSSQFKKIFEEMPIEDLANSAIFIPRILQKGNAKLDDMVKPILAGIAKWAATPGEKQLVLVGISNGARIARAIEVELAKTEIQAQIKKLRVVSIVGANKGSRLVDLANKIGLSWVLSKNILEEMPVASKRNRQLNQEWVQGLSGGLKRDYVFIAAPQGHDWQVPNYDSSLMAVELHPAHYAIVPGHGHNSIVNASAKAVAKIILG